MQRAVSSAVRLLRPDLRRASWARFSPVPLGWASPARYEPPVHRCSGARGARLRRQFVSPRLDHMHVVDMVFHWARIDPHRPAIILPELVTTFAGLADAIDSISNRIDQLALDPREPVATAIA